MKNLSEAVHTEDVKVESYFKTHVAATAVGAALATALIVFSVMIFFHL